MTSTVFLTKDCLWKELGSRVRDAQHVDVAVAYLGQGASKLLPLRAGHRLVVNMSLPTVRSGATDPSEVERLMSRGVEVYSRRKLHAKMVIADDALICSSANISHHSLNVLEEVGMLTTEAKAVREAKTFFDSICTEPVRAEYLARCKQEYRPPRVYGGESVEEAQVPPPQPISRPKLWLVKLREFDLPEEEQDQFDQGLSIAKKRLKKKATTEIDSFHWSRKPRMADQLETGDWVIRAITQKQSGKTKVHAPARFLDCYHYPRGKALDKERWIFYVEVPTSSQSMSWSRFQRFARALPGLEKLKTARTRSIQDETVADQLLKLWTPAGTIAAE